MKKKQPNHQQGPMNKEQKTKRQGEVTAVSQPPTPQPPTPNSPWNSVVNRRAGMFMLLILLLLALPASRALAQSYSFAVPELKMQVFVQPDASIHIVYDITFENFVSAIDIVDIVTPNRGYDLANFSASINVGSLPTSPTSQGTSTWCKVP